MNKKLNGTLVILLISSVLILSEGFGLNPSRNGSHRKRLRTRPSRIGRNAGSGNHSELRRSFAAKFLSPRRCDKLERRCARRECASCCKIFEDRCAHQNKTIQVGSIEEVNQALRGPMIANRLTAPLTLADGATGVILHTFADIETVMRDIDLINDYYARDLGITVEETPWEIHAESSPFFGGDVILTPEQSGAIVEELHLAQPGDRIRRKIEIPTEFVKHWPTTIHYQYDSVAGSDAKTVEAMSAAARFWTEHTCLNFVNQMPPDGPDGSYIVVSKNGGCSSMKGMVGGPQGLSLDSGCEQMGIAAHEIGHALGLWHEQARPDRDSFVNINFANIDPGKVFNFYKCKEGIECETNNIPYDYGSVMQYGAKSFSVNDEFTIVPRNTGYLATLGSRSRGPSFYDVKQINRVYCKYTCSGNTLDCLHGGYTDPSNCNRCLCPDGWSGVICENIAEGRPEPCGGISIAANEWQMLQSPNYPGLYPRGQICTWKIKTLPGKHVEFQFDGNMFDFPYSPTPLCDWSYVEVRYSGDMANTGARFCGTKVPQEVIRSDSNELVVLLRTQEQYPSSGFHARYRVYGEEGTQSKDCQLTSWSSWTDCDALCGGGLTVRNRRVVGQADGLGKPCSQHPLEEFEMCNSQPCARGGRDVDKDCLIAPWSDWMPPCPEGCGPEEYQFRIRQILHEGSGAGVLCDNPLLTENRGCDRKSCFAGTTEAPSVPPPPKVECEDSDWSVWTQCSATCGAGVRTREKVVRTLQADRGECKESEEKLTEDCYAPVQCKIPSPPKVECVDSDWSVWTQCSATCGAGVRTREKVVRTMQADRGDCRESEEKLTEDCYAPVQCKTDCEVSEWEEWDECSVTCGEGTHTRRRMILQEAEFGGKPCSYFPQKESRECFADAKCEKCVLSEWGAWAECSATCGSGKKSRSRAVSEESGPGGCGPGLMLDEHVDCFLEECEADKDCLMDEWFDWSSCSATCGTSARKRSRIVLSNEQGEGFPCAEMPTIESEKCDVPESCEDTGTFDCQLEQWTDWSECSNSCGPSAFRARTRKVLREAYNGGRECDGYQKGDTQQCPLEPCPQGKKGSYKSVVSTLLTLSGLLVWMLLG